MEEVVTVATAASPACRAVVNKLISYESTTVYNINYVNYLKSVSSKQF